VVECTYVRDASFAVDFVADVRLPAAPPSTRRALIFLLVIVLGIFVMFYLLWHLKP